ncbi:protein phosphatase 1 regulatory subunit 14C-like [Amphiura filiformis]|uniref:protein phosphatase 1 regulatory subunit 14C-like n=1 Tax=Amphiura filiformis TaxID=82378 RepID=UPI003B21FE5A
MQCRQIKYEKKRYINRTAKYNRKEMRMRLQVEEWMDRQLRDLYECEEDEEYPVEIDIDELIELSEAERYTSIQETLVDATQPTEEFIQQLLLKIQNYQKLKTP